MRVLIAMLLLLLAGCADAPAGPVDEPTFQATDTTGVILGVVVDETITPIADVTITLPETGDTTTTDAEGIFGFGDLEPGFYTVEAARPGYAPAVTQTTVDAGIDTPPKVRIQMASDPVTLPRADAYVFDGMVKCGLSYIAACGVFDIVGIDVGDNFMATFELPAAPQYITMESVWTGTQPTGDSFQLRLGHTPAGPATVLDAPTGPSPLQARINETVILGAGIGSSSDLVGRMFVWEMEGTGIDDHTGQCVPVPTITTWCQGPGAAIDQKFELFVHAFHNFTPDEDWQFSIDGEPMPQ